MILYDKEHLARNAAKGTLDVCFNEKNGFIYNKAFDVKKVNYSNEYVAGNISIPGLAYYDYKIDWLSRRYIQPNWVIVDVGCGDGIFIKRLAEKIPDVKCFGFDTSYKNIQTDTAPKTLEIFNEYYGGNNRYNLEPNLIILNHVLEHIHNPVQFLQLIHNTMKDDAFVFIDVPDAEWILRNTVIYDFFYEHCQYWYITSLINVLEATGFKIIEFCNQFSGQNLWVMAKRCINTGHKVGINNNIKKLCNEFITSKDCQIRKIKDSIEYLGTRINIAIFGAAAKGIMFANIFDPAKKLISCLIDDDSRRQDKYIPGTGHPVVSSSYLINTVKKLGGGGVIILNNNYIQTVKNFFDFDRVSIYSYHDLLDLETGGI
jgi:hypothetical protein